MSAVLLDAAITGTANNGTSVTATSVIVSALATRLISFVGLHLSGGVPPTTNLHNSVAMTLLGSHTDTLGGGIYNISAWYLDNPSVGTFNTVAAWTGSTSGAGIVSIPVENCDLTRIPLIGTGTDGNSTTPACTAPGSASAIDMQLAGVFVNKTAISTAGANQSVVSAAPALPRVSINGLDSFSTDFITPGNPGNFSWSNASGIWTSIALTLFAPGGAILMGQNQY